MKKIIQKKKKLSRSEKLFILIGTLGLLPFIFGFFDLMVNKNNLFLDVNLPKYYGSIILTFLGAIYWGAILNLFTQRVIVEQVKFIIII